MLTTRSPRASQPLKIPNKTILKKMFLSKVLVWEKLIVSVLSFNLVKMDGFCSNFNLVKVDLTLTLRIWKKWIFE
jgi:hypothetical protein